jgi:hypothetical protein
MKSQHAILGALGLGAAGVGILMSVMNPSEEAFSKFAIAQLKTRGCKELPQLIQSRCPNFVDENQATIEKLIVQNSDRRNYYLFSLYETNLSVRSVVPDLPFFINVPTFHLRTVGMFGQFYVYEAEKRS